MDTFVLDTSALISNPTIYERFHNSIVIIPIIVLSELDNVKKQQNEAGKNARVCIKKLDKISELGYLDNGILLDNNILLKVDSKYQCLNENYKKYGNLDYGDTKILVNAIEVNNENSNTTLITNDFNLRIRARSFGVKAISCEENNSINELYNGYITVANESLGLQLADVGWADPEDLPPMVINECVLFTDKNGTGISIGRKVSDDQVLLIESKKPWGLSSKNKEQAFAIDMLLDNNIKLITMTGMAGTGKSILTLACALQLIVEQKKYNKCIIYRPIESVGKDLGYLPGTVDEKINPYFQNIIDNLEVLSNKRKNNKADIEYLKQLGKIDFEPITYIRGRSISDALIICDEAQNLSKEDIKTLLTRVSHNTKVILNGDVNQIDNSSLDASNNGLTYVIEKFKDSEIAGHIHFTQGERSVLAEEAAKRL